MVYTCTPTNQHSMDKIYLTAWVDDTPEIHVAHELNKTSKELIINRIKNLECGIENRIACKMTDDNCHIEQFWDIDIAIMQNQQKMLMKLLIEY